VRVRSTASYDERLQSIQSESNEDRRRTAIDQFLRGEETLHIRTGRLIYRSMRVPSRTADDVIQLVRETALLLVSGGYRPWVEDIAYETCLYVKSRDRVARLMRSASATPMTGMTTIKQAGLNLREVESELAQELKRTPTKQEALDRYEKLYGKSHFAKASMQTEFVPLSDFDHPEDVEPDQYQETFVRVASADGSVSSVELAEVIKAVLDECKAIDLATYEYAKAWMEAVSLGDTKGRNDVPDNRMEEILGYSHAKVKQAREGFQRARMAVIKSLHDS
jgi:hypothetical protein